MHSSAIDLRSPAVSSMSISRPGWTDETWFARAMSSSVSLPIALDHDDDVVALAMRAGDVLGDGSDAVGVGDRGAAELLHQEAHDGGRYQCRLWGDPGKPVGFVARGHCQA